MMKNDRIRALSINVYLGSTMEFQISADESATAPPRDFRYNVEGSGPAARDLLLQVLGKILAAYGTNPTVTLCVQGARIRRDSECM